MLEFFSRTPDRNFRCFYSISHTVPACGKDKNEQPHVDRMLAARQSVNHCYVKITSHVASQRIQDCLEVFFIFFQYKMRYLLVSKKEFIFV